MGYRRRHRERLFVYCDTRPRDLHYKIGQYICAAPPHITFAKIYTNEPEHVYDVFDEISAQYDPIPIVRNGIMLVGERRRRGAARLDDVSGDLAMIQEEIFGQFTDNSRTFVNQHQRIGNGFIPHATFDYPDREAPYIPASFDIHSITITRTLPMPINAGVHHRNIVTHIATLGSSGQ